MVLQAQQGGGVVAAHVEDAPHPLLGQKSKQFFPVGIKAAVVVVGVGVEDVLDGHDIASELKVF